MSTTINIRLAHKDDLPQITLIYNQAILAQESTGDLVEFDPANRTEWFSQFKAESYPIYVAEENNEIVGYVCLTPYRSGKVAMQKIAEVTFYIHEKHQKKGIGSILLKHIIEVCPTVNKDTLIAVLFDINKGSIKLLEKFGFSKWGFLPNVVRMPKGNYNHFIYGLQLTN